MNKQMKKRYINSLIVEKGCENPKLQHEARPRGVTGVLNCPYIEIYGCKKYSVLGNEKLGSNKSIGVKNATNKVSSAVRTCLYDQSSYPAGWAENLLGVFIFTNSVRTGSLKSVFLYYDVSLKQVSNFNLHAGPNYYKQFQRFITRTLENTGCIQDIRQSDQKVVLAPVNYVNKSTIEEFKERNVEIILCKVTEQSLPMEVSIIRRQVRNNLSVISDNESLANIVRTVNVRLADKGLLK